MNALPSTPHFVKKSVIEFFKKTFLKNDLCSFFQIDGTLSTIEFRREALENASTNSEVLSVMGSAAKALKTAHNHMDVDQVLGLF